MENSPAVRTANAVVDISKLSPEAQEKARALAKSIAVNDSQAVIQYGVSCQSDIASFADTILSQVRSKDSGHSGEILTELMFKVKDLNVGSLAPAGGIAAIPIIGGLFDAARRFIAKYEKLSSHIERIVDELEKTRMVLLKDVAMLDQLFKKSEGYRSDLDILIAAGTMKLAELNETVLPEMKKKADASNDPADAQTLSDLTQFISRFEKKLHDLSLSRMISIQTMPQIRLIQNNDQLLVEKIQSSILNTIPLWKNQVVIAISIFRQQKALALQKDVTKTTNELLTKNSELLKQGSIETAKESERGIVEIETLKKVNEDLITTIEETLRIQAEGKQKRAAAETELVNLEQDLKTRLRNAMR